MNPQGKEWNLLYLQNTKITLQAKALFRWPIKSGFTNLFLCHKRWDFRMQKLQWTGNGKSSRQSQHGNWRKSRARRRLQKESPLCYIDEHTSPQKRGVRTRIRKYRGRVVLRGDIVKDDSGAHAVFTEQGSSASQMTASKEMDVFVRLPDCAGQAADAVSAYSQVKLEDAPGLIKNSWVRMSRRMDTSSTTQMSKILGKHWRSCGTSWTKFIWTPIGRIVMRKTIRGSFIRTWMEEIRVLGVRHKNGWKEAEYGVDLDEPTSFLDHVLLGCTQSECKPNEIIEEFLIDVWIMFFCWSSWKVTRLWKTSGKDGCAVLRHGRTCSKMRWAILWIGKQESGAAFTKFQVLAWMIINLKTGRTWISRRTITSMLTNCVEVLVPGTNWKTRHSMVCQQTCKSSHKMDSGMRQTIGKIDFIHSPHKWLPTTLSCG